MTKYTAIVPCTIEYYWNPEIKGTEDEPVSEEEFYIDSVQIGKVDLWEGLRCSNSDKLVDEFYEYLKGMRDEG